MKYRLNLETAIIATKCGIAPIACWPLPVDASASDVLRRNLLWWFLFIHQIIALSGWIYNIYENINDINLVFRVITEMLAVIGTITKMIVCKAETSRLQELLAEMEMFLKDATSEELEVIQFYVDKCTLSHTCFYVCAVFGPLPFIFGPILTSSQPFPGEVAFPFSIESIEIWAILYLSQSFMAIQVGSMVVLNFMYAILLWYTIARFEMLSKELQRVKNDDDITRCIQKHQELLGYADKLSMSTRIIALQIVAIAIIAVAAAGFIIIRRPPLFHVIKYVFYELCSAIQLFIFTWPADNLIDTTLQIITLYFHISSTLFGLPLTKDFNFCDLIQSRKVGVAAYTCDWVGKSSEILSKLFIITQRSQISMNIAIRGVLPPLSLKLYGTTITTSFSYLTTLRAVIRD